MYCLGQHLILMLGAILYHYLLADSFDHSDVNKQSILLSKSIDKDLPSRFETIKRNDFYTIVHSTYANSFLQIYKANDNKQTNIHGYTKFFVIQDGTGQ